MIFKTKNKDRKVGSKKIVTRFAFFPTFLDTDGEEDTWIWLEFYKVEKEYYCYSGMYEDTYDWITRRRFVQ